MRALVGRVGVGSWRERERERERERDRQTDRQTDRHKQTSRHRERVAAKTVVPARLDQLGYV